MTPSFCEWCTAHAVALHQQTRVLCVCECTYVCACAGTDIQKGCCLTDYGFYIQRGGHDVTLRDFYVVGNPTIPMFPIHAENVDGFTMTDVTVDGV